MVLYPRSKNKNTNERKDSAEFSRDVSFQSDFKSLRNSLISQQEHIPSAHCASGLPLKFQMTTSEKDESKKLKELEPDVVDNRGSVKRFVEDYLVLPKLLFLTFALQYFSVYIYRMKVFRFNSHTKVLQRLSWHIIF